jgi:hypothetical protein
VLLLPLPTGPLLLLPWACLLLLALRPLLCHWCQYMLLLLLLQAH